MNVLIDYAEMTRVPDKQPRDVQEKVGTNEQVKLFVENARKLVDIDWNVLEISDFHEHEHQIEEKPETLPRVDDGPGREGPAVGRDVDGHGVRDLVGCVVEETFDFNRRCYVEKDHGNKGQYVDD